MRLVCGLDLPGLTERLASAPPTPRPVLSLDLSAARDTDGFVDRALAQLAEAVSSIWPFLWDGEDFSGMRDDHLSLTHLSHRLTRILSRWPGVSRGWAEAIVIRLLRGSPPRLRDISPEREWRQLATAFAPQGIVIALPLVAYPAFTGAVEWLARHASVSILVLCDHLPADAAFTRLRYGARVLDRIAASPEPAPVPPLPDAPAVLALPEASGRPHPQSAAELKLYTLIRAATDLAPLFAFNRFVPGVATVQAKADLLWADGRLVVEIDGPEHRHAVKYRADRHRDYALMLAGYRVLRMTNEDILTDAALALARIRDVVRLVQGEAR